MKKNIVVYVVVGIIILAIGYMSFSIVNQANKKKLYITPILNFVKVNEKITLKAELISKSEYNKRNKIGNNKSTEGKEAKDVIWSSSDEDIATIDSNGVVTGIKNGQTIITATTKDKKIKESTTIVVYENEVSFSNEESYTCKEGDSFSTLVSISGDSMITRYGLSAYIKDEKIAKLGNSELQTNCIDCKLIKIDCLKKGKTILVVSSPAGINSSSELIVE